MSHRFAVLALASLGAASAVAPTHVNLRVPVTLGVPNPCAPGETVVLSGTVHLVGQVRTDASGTTARLNVNLQNFGGRTEAGRLYRAALNGKATLDLAAGGLPAQASGQVHVRLISQGPTDNFSFKLKLDVAVDANGNVAVAPPTALPEGTCNG
ncbi:hypothetical protein [Deinococcus murrayi]|uniref:hypothetical protein n=1 Tax=Deinococcus murrayi TaxID=68910 RepID=UPI000487D2E4|nr:hypothetical protein [Deinococcus murrayi]